MEENTAIQLLQMDGKILIDSRIVAKGIDIEHKSLMETIYTYQSELEEFGQLRFETEVGYRAQGGGNPIKYVLLNRNQAGVVISFSRNTAQVVRFKVDLFKAIDTMEKQLAQSLQGPSKQGSIEESMDRFSAELAALREQMEAIAPNRLRKAGQAQRSEPPQKVSRTERRALKYDDYSDASIKARCLMSLLKLTPGWHDRREVLNVGDPVLGVLGLSYTGGVLNVLSRDGLLLRRGGNGHNALYRLRD